MNILQVNSSVRGSASASTRLAGNIVARLKTQHPSASLTVRDLGNQPILDEAALQALFTPVDARSPEQAARVAIDDETIAQVQAADVVVIGVPMYNFGVPVQLKGKKVYVALARGGLYRDTPADSQVPYLKSVLGFLGMNDVTFIHAEGLSMGEESASKAFADAEADIVAQIA